VSGLAVSRARRKCRKPRHPEHTLLYRTIAENFETWLELIERIAALVPPPRTHRHGLRLIDAQGKALPCGYTAFDHFA